MPQLQVHTLSRYTTVGYLVDYLTLGFLSENHITLLNLIDGFDMFHTLTSHGFLDISHLLWAKSNNSMFQTRCGLTRDGEGGKGKGTPLPRHRSYR